MTVSFLEQLERKFTNLPSDQTGFQSSHMRLAITKQSKSSQNSGVVSSKALVMTPVLPRGLRMEKGNS